MLKYTIYSIQSSPSQNCQFPTRQSFAHSSQEMYFPIIKTIPLSISQIRTNSNGATLSLNLWLVNCTGIWLWESAPFFFFYYNKCITTCALSTTTLLLPTFSGTLQFSQYARGCLISEHPSHCPYQATHRAQRTWDEALSSACLAFLPRSACLYPAWLSPHPYCCPSPAFHISLGIHSHSTFKMPLEGCLCLPLHCFILFILCHFHILRKSMQASLPNRRPSCSHERSGRLSSLKLSELKKCKVKGSSLSSFSHNQF